MTSRFDQRERIRRRLENERGTLFGHGGLRVALVYPSPYHVGMSSLGFQAIYRVINLESPHSAERAFLPDESWGDRPLLAYESLDPVGDFDVLAFSLSYELELVGLVECLRLAGLAPLSEDRTAADPLILVGGPLTFSNPIPAGPFADIIVMGEGERLVLDVLERIATGGAGAKRRNALLDDLAGTPSLYVPSRQGEHLEPIGQADDRLLPAYSQIVTPDTELANMHLVEAARGCHRRCSFCVMRRSTNGGMRAATVERILETIPEHATRVGLVGAAVTDHPHLPAILEQIIEMGREIGISSLRADRLTPEVMGLLQRGGYRTLTVASDGASERLRRALMKSIKAHHLRHAANMAAQFGMRRLKLYMMLGVPGETDEDLEELCEFSEALADIAPLAMTLSPFVAKRNTPLDGEPFAGIAIVERRIGILRKRIGRRVDLRSSSAKWAWVEYCLAQGGFGAGYAALEAHAGRGRFAAWKRAIGSHAPEMIDQLRPQAGATSTGG